MKKVIASLALILLAVPALAVDIAKDPAVVIEGSSTVYENVMNRGDAAVVSIIDGTFSDMSAYYAAGLTAAGYAPDVIFDPLGGGDYSAYLIVICDTGDMWWYPTNGFPSADFMAYMDGGGKFAMIGQDFLYATGEYGFATAYLGMGSVIEDTNYSDAGQLDWTGTAGGALEGMSDSMLPCFASNPWFTDAVTPTSTGVCMWGSPMAPGPQEGGSATTYSLLSTVEFGCGGVDVVGAIAAYLFGSTATDATSISSVKSLY